MKVIAVNQHRYCSNEEFKDVLVQMTCREMAVLLGDNYHLPSKLVIEPGTMIEISERFCHAIDIEGKVAAATKLPTTLRTLADMLEMQHPAIEAVVTEDEPPPSE